MAGETEAARFTEEGMVRLCLAVFTTAQKDYNMFRGRRDKAPPGSAQRAEAQRDLDSLERSFRRGDMDLYAMALEHLSAMDVWKAFGEAYDAKETKGVNYSALKYRA